MDALPLTRRYRPLHTSSDLGWCVYLVLECSEQTKPQTTRDPGTGTVCFITVDVNLPYPGQLKHGRRQGACSGGAMPRRSRLALTQ